MSEKKVITIFGATGAQGGGLARAILQDKASGFTVRAVTRNPDSEKAKALAELGAELIQADIDDPKSMQRALDGAYGAYFVTFFWEHFSPEKELAEARSMAQAAKDANLKHVIWSTLDDTRQYVPLDDDRMPTLQGKYKVPHFDAKGEANHFFTDLDVPVTFLLTTFYWENLLYFGMGPKRGDDGKLTITFPMGDKKLAGIAAADIGKCAYGILKKGPEMIGKTVGIAGELLTCQAMADALSKTLGQEVQYHEITPETYRNLGFPGADDLGNMFQFYRDFEDVFSKTRNVQLAKELNPELQNFEMWLQENGKKIPLE
ncbi:NmrA/HSCARG family protein [Adhaeribacter sp. BT258]|uniref:NmrA/HSCARG family protein n=1 Tax=Adhaeribacter terrigena TaxID=2793070 RepID=A0ABS1BW83_9BACT|nr:NmrA/HSCARG family protein [Adhaeribacter terrigena]MBK0401353.1 NmrA/HSCARG family protein [Adhaeribacter terrigena]